VIDGDIAADITISDPQGYTGWMDMRWGALDLTGGDVPIRRVQCFVNGELCHDSGNINQMSYSWMDGRSVSAGDIYTLELVITNNHGQQHKITKTVIVNRIQPSGQDETGGGGGGGWWPCFACDTMVLMADNSVKYISDIQVGDMVQAFDVETGQTLTAEVTATDSGEADYYYLINGNLKVTPPHPFFTDEGQWVKITDLEVGNKIRSYQGLVEIISMEKINSGQRICNISVHGYNNFFVSANGKDFYLVKEGP
jgi:hypothetical protein